MRVTGGAVWASRTTLDAGMARPVLAASRARRSGFRIAFIPGSLRKAGQHEAGIAVTRGTNDLRQVAGVIAACCGQTMVAEQGIALQGRETIEADECHQRDRG